MSTSAEKPDRPRNALQRAAAAVAGFLTATSNGRTRVAKGRLLLARLFIPAATLWPFMHGLDEGIAFYSGHLTYALIPALSFLISTLYVASNYLRTHPPQPQKGKPARPPRPARPPLRQVRRDAADLVANHDHLVLRLFMWAALAAAIAIPLREPVTLVAVTAPGAWQDEAFLRTVLQSAAAPLLAAIAIYLRAAHVATQRHEAVEEIYAVARDTLDYPKPWNGRGTPTQRELILGTPWRAVDVRDWRSLREPNEFFVYVPERMSVDDVRRWDDFDTNLNAKVPRDEGWRIQRDPRGRGALVGPANYPTAVLWDGEYDKDPLTFVLGRNLETGEVQRLTLGEVSPHVAVSGGTSSGKTSGAEIIAAQCLIKPMPWDPELRGQVHVVDPKGPFARRWAGRPGVIVSNGQEDSAETDDDGEPITGIMVMSEHMNFIEAEHKRRQAVLARYPDVGTWVHLPDDVKRREKFVPIIVILDEYLDHTDMEGGTDSRVEKENAARANITRMAAWHARKYRNVGMHTILIAQEVKMTGIGSNLMRNLPVRIITGQMDQHQMRTMFNTEDVPNLPASRVVVENGERNVKTIPGRARVMNALGQPIHKIQIMWFGGPTNSETLDKWLPRGTAPTNGDFSLPAGKPRTAEDFEGTAATGGDRPDDDTDAASTADSDDQETTGLDAAEEEARSTPPGPPPAARPESDQIFPAAAGDEAPCTVDGCVDDATTTCPACDRAICEYHLERSPDPADDTETCTPCADAHPLRRAGAAALYARLHRLATDAGLAIALSHDHDTITAAVLTPAKKKVLVLTVSAGKARVQSRSGEVSGKDVPDRIEQIIEHYLASTAREAATGATT